MATLAHCIYCFEVLSAALERQKFPSLEHVGTLWDEYQHALITTDAEDDAQMTDADDLDDSSSSSSSEESDDADIIVNTGDPVRNDRRPETHLAPPTPVRRTLPSPSSASSSSTPSLQSKSSGSSSTATQASSRTSLNEVDGTYAGAVRSSGAARESPMFVTWNITSRTSGSKNLRGCIGTFEKQPLEDGLRTYALTSYVCPFSPLSLFSPYIL